MKIAAYCRVSTNKDEQLESLEHQKEFFCEYAKRYGYELFRVYADEGITGTSLKKRTEFQRLMRDAQYGLFDIVVVKDISRVARNTVDFLQSIRKLKTLGISMNFITANMSSLGDSEFILTIFGAMAQEESANLSKRVKWGKKINAQKGRVPQRIFGYERIDNFTLQINEDEASIVKEIYRLYNHQGLGCRTISIKLNEMGAKTKFDCEWNARGVRRILVNPIYCGHYINHKYEIEDYLTGKQIRIPEEDHFHHDRPDWAIISREEFDEAQRIMDSRRKIYQNKEIFRGARYSSKHVFSTLIKCAHCGRSFCRKTYTYANTRVYWKCCTNDQYTAEKCSNNVTIDEKELLESLRDYFTNLIKDSDCFVERVLHQFESHLPNELSFENTPKTSEEQRKKLLRKKDKYKEMYANDLITMDELKNVFSEVEASLKKIDEHEKQQAVMESIMSDRKALISKYSSEISKFLNMENVTNMDLRKIIDHINVDKDKRIEIVLRDLSDDGFAC